MRMGNLLAASPVATRMDDTSTHPGLDHVTVVPSNYDGDDGSAQSEAADRSGPGWSRSHT